MPHYHRILVPFDGSAPARDALREALRLASASGGHVRLLHVLELMDHVPPEGESLTAALRSARSAAMALLRDGTAACAAAGVEHDARVVEDLGRRLGDAVDEEARAWKADIVVAGSHGRRGLGRLLLGSGAEQVVRHASTPVLVVKPTAARA